MSQVDDTDLPRLSVVLPVRNEEGFIAQTLQYLQNQQYPENKIEILVVDGESTDRTAGIVANMASADRRIRLLNNPKRLASAGRAIGATEATGDIITFIDGHTYIDNLLLLQNTARLMAKKQVSVLSRPQFLDTPDNSLFQQAVSLARKNPLGHGLDSTIYTRTDAYVDPSSSGASYRRELFATVGYFDERFDACEDVEFNFRLAKAGYRSFTSLDLAVYYYPRESLRELFGQLRRYGVGRFRLTRKHPDSLSVGTLVPPIFVTMQILLAVCAVLSETALIALGILVGVYGVITILTSLSLAARHGLKFLPYLPVIFWTIHWALGWGFLTEMIRTLGGRGVSLERWSVPPKPTRSP